MKKTGYKVQHIVQQVGRAHSFVQHVDIPAHERHTLSAGPITAHGCASLDDAKRLLNLRVHGLVQ